MAVSDDWQPVHEEMFYKELDSLIAECTALINIKPPAEDFVNLKGIENMMEGIGTQDIISYEIDASSDGVRFGIRGAQVGTIRRQIEAHYPQARLSIPEVDPLDKREGEVASTTVLTVEGDQMLPIRTFEDEDITSAGADPMLAVIGAISDMGTSERVVVRAIAREMPHNWSAGYQQQAMGGAGSTNEIQRTTENMASRATTSPQGTGGGGSSGGSGAFGISFVLAGAMLGIMAIWALTSDINMNDVGASNWTMVWVKMIGGLFIAIPAMIGFLKFFGQKKKYYDPALVAARVSGLAYNTEIQIIVFEKEVLERTPRGVAIADRLVRAFSHYDSPLGNQFVKHHEFEGVPGYRMGFTFKSKLWGFSRDYARSVLGVKELASLWHLPSSTNSPHSVERTTSVQLAAPDNIGKEGVPVGKTTVGIPRVIRFNDDLMRRHHFYVARTRMGKSTMMGHIARHVMEEKAAGRTNKALVVIDPHSDLVDDILHWVPLEVIHKVRLIELGDPDRVPGINLLDTQIFKDRDNTSDMVVNVSKSIWERWGPRMEGILSHTIKSLHEANAHPATRRAEQYTLLDALRMLSDETFRKEVIDKVRDPALKQWWFNDFGKWPDRQREEAIAPVTNRLGAYASSTKARAVLGQSFCTIDIRKTIEQGNILLVSTAQAYLGPQVSSLMGSAILNLVDTVIREQGQKPPADRVAATVIVDEMQTIPAEYEAMMSENAKFGGNMVLATQSLSKLDAMRETGMKDTILSNTGCLGVFQVSGTDARELLLELGKRHLTEDDITQQAPHHCYIRSTGPKDFIPTYSMALLPPAPKSASVMKSIRRVSMRFTRPFESVSRDIEKKLTGLDHPDAFRAGDPNATVQNIVRNPE